MNCRGNSHFWKARTDKLKHSHLSCGILHSHTIWSQSKITFTTNDIWKNKNKNIQGDSYLLKQQKMTFFDGNGWFQVKTFLWWNLDHFNIFQSIYSHFLIWPTFDLKRAYGLQKAGIKKWSFGTHQKLVSIYKLMIEKLTNILQNEIYHVKLSYLTAQKIFWT